MDKTWNGPLTLWVTGHYPLYLIDVPTNKSLYWIENIAIVNKQIKSEEETIVFWIDHCFSSRSVSMKTVVMIFNVAHNTQYCQIFMLCGFFCHFQIFTASPSCTTTTSSWTIPFSLSKRARRINHMLQDLFLENSENNDGKQCLKITFFHKICRF